MEAFGCMLNRGIWDAKNGIAGSSVPTPLKEAFGSMLWWIAVFRKVRAALVFGFAGGVRHGNNQKEIHGGAWCTVERSREYETEILAKAMRAGHRTTLSLIVLCYAVFALCYAVFAQTVAPGFQFPATVKPSDSLAITGTDLAGITAISLKAAGKPDLAATGVHASPTSVTFIVPATASGTYMVALSPGTMAPIPLTVAPAVPPPSGASGAALAIPPPPAAPGASGAPAVTPSVTPPETAPAAGTEQIVRIYMPDGQLKSHSIRVYVTRDILPSQNPRLRLLRSHAVTKRAVEEAALEEPGVVAPSQEWIESVEGQQVRRSGTLLLFDISHIDCGFRAMVRVMPVVSWTEGNIARVAVGAREVNIGNTVLAWSWTVAVVILTLLVVIVLSWRPGSNPLLLLTGVDGHLSLAQTQIACWTVAVGAVVLLYGLIRLEIPNIPASLLALMGASLATGGIAFFQDAQKQQAAVNAGVAPIHRTWEWGDLVRVFPPGQPPQQSLSKAQMLFWTMLLLVLFVSKSLLGGVIWEVPWALVALMGFSQAGYLAPKLAPQP